MCSSVGVEVCLHYRLTNADVAVSPALQNVAAKAERILIQIKVDIKVDFGRPPSPDGNGRYNGPYVRGEHKRL